MKPLAPMRPWMGVFLKFLFINKINRTEKSTVENLSINRKEFEYFCMSTVRRPGKLEFS